MKKDNSITNINDYRASNMPDYTGVNTYNQNYITNVNEAEYGNQVEFVSEEMINSYMQAINTETPDLWSRIDVGFDTENADIIKTKRVRHTRTKKVAGFVAAAAIVTLIAVPVLGLGRMDSEKSMDKSYSLESAMEEIQESESVYEDFADGVAAEGALNDEVEEITESATQIDNHENYSNDINQQLHWNLSYENNDIKGVQTDERTVVVIGEFITGDEENGTVFKISVVEGNEYSEIVLDLGDCIILSNPDYILGMNTDIKKVKITLDSLCVDDAGNIGGRITDIKHVK